MIGLKESLESTQVAEDHPAMRLSRVLDDVRAEHARQDAKFGDQTHRRDRIADGELDIYRVEMEWCKAECDRHEQEPGGASWTDILLEEVFEALCERDPERLRTELIQVAAVAVQWSECLDKRKV